jgi:crossover junction endodeoxyribonuclease RusA
MDNLVKPIQDALQGVSYPTDGRVDVTGNWRHINGHFRVRYMSKRLAAAFSDGQEFVHIRIWLARKRRDLG